jgi:hypothetical protein
VAAGEQVGFSVYGEKGHIASEHSDPDKLKFALQGKTLRMLVPGKGACHPPPSARRASRPVRWRDFSRRLPRSIAIMPTSWQHGRKARRPIRWRCGRRWSRMARGHRVRRPHQSHAEGGRHARQPEI